MNVDMGDWWTPTMMPDPSLGEHQTWKDCVWDSCERFQSWTDLVKRLS